MKIPRSIAIAAALLVAALFWWLVRDTRERGTTDVSFDTATEPDVREAATPRTVATNSIQKNRQEVNAEVAASTNVPAPEWGRRLEESEDFWVFAESAIGPAKRGDGYARFWLAIALNECEFVYPMFFVEDPPGKLPRRLTLDEAQQRVAGQRSLYSPDDVILLEKRCGRLNQAKDSPFGNGKKWMDAALAVDNPIALAGKAAGKSLGTRDNLDPEKIRESQAEVRRLSVEAARSGTPEALFHIGAAAANLVQEDATEARRRELSWMLAACLRTPNCDGFNEWKRKRCNWDAQCQPFETMRDIIRRDAGSDFGEVERRAREINEKIDAGTLEESDI